MLSLCSFVFAGCLAADVTQTPPLFLTSPGNKVSLNCSHENSNYLYKYWYRQQKGEALQLLGYTYRTDQATMEITDKRISMKPDDVERNTLSISEVSAADSAVYYCASSIHSDTGRGQDCAQLAASRGTSHYRQQRDNKGM